MFQNRSEKKDLNSFSNSINNIKEMITYFGDKNHKSKIEDKNFRNLNTILKSVDSVVNITAFRLIILPISAGIACGLSLGNKMLYEIVMKTYSKNIKQNEEDQQTNKPFDKLYTKSVQGNVLDKNEFDILCNVFAKYVDETKIDFFSNMNIRTISNFV